MTAPRIPLIAFAFHAPEPGGAVRSVLRAVPELEALGWRTCFYVHRPGPLYDELVAAGADVAGRPREVGFSRAWLRSGAGVRKLADTGAWLRGWSAFLRERRPDVVHANSVWTLPEAVVARAGRRPTVLHVHEMFPASSWKARAVSRLMPALGLHVVGASSACATSVGPDVGVVHESTTVPDEPIPAPTGPGRVVGCMGAISPRKGSDVFVAAAVLLRERRPDLELRLVGSPERGDRNPAWAAGVLERAARAQVTHVPHAAPFDELRSWDVAVLTSRKDPFPLVVLEAMASGLAVVGTAVDGIVEQLAEDAGVLVPVDDPVAVADAVEGLLDDPVRRAELGERARARVIANWTPAHQARALDAAYREVLTR